MAKPYSMDLRERVVSAVERDGMSRHAAAERYGVAISTAIRWVRRGRRIGSLLDNFPPNECANYLRNSGYGPA